MDNSHLFNKKLENQYLLFRYWQNKLILIISELIFVIAWTAYLFFSKWSPYNQQLWPDSIAWPIFIAIFAVGMSFTALIEAIYRMIIFAKSRIEIAYEDKKYLDFLKNLNSNKQAH